MVNNMKRMSIFMLTVLLAWTTCIIPNGFTNIKASTLSMNFNKAYASVGDVLEIEISGANVDDCDITWEMDDEIILEDATSLLLNNDHLQQLIKVSVSDGTTTLSDQILISDLPVVYIDVENNADIVSKDEYVNANIKFSGNDKYTQDIYYEGITEIKGRGNSTWQLPKKPYRLKLDEKADLYGMGASKHWTLIANYLDESLLRNQIAHEMSKDFGLYAIKSTFVDVVLNGKKVGNYQLCEHIRVDENRVNVYDWESVAEDIAKAVAKQYDWEKDLRDELEDDLVSNLNWITTGKYTFYPEDFTLEATEITISDYVDLPNDNGGFLIELDESMDELTCFTTSLNQPIMFKSPEYLYTNETMLNGIKGYINAFEASIQNTTDFTTTYQNNKTHYSDLYDMDSLLSYFLIQEIFFNYDAMKRSTYMYKDVDEKIYMGPAWDFDFSSGSEQVFEYYDRWETLYFSYDSQSKSWYKYLIKDPYFVAKLRDTYWNYRSVLDDIVKDGGSIDTYQTYLATSAKENSALWHDYEKFENHVSVFKNWLKNRIGWLDEQFKTQESIATSLQMNQYSNLNISFVQSKDTHSLAVTSDERYDMIVNDGYDIILQMSDSERYDLYIDDTYFGKVGNFSIIPSSSFTTGSVFVFKNGTNVSSKIVKVNGDAPIVDITPPEVPTSAYVSDITTTSITVEWNTSVSDDVVKYVITNWDTKELLGETTDTSFVVENLTPNTKYYLAVHAEDAAGNESAATIVSDTTLPEPLDAVTVLRADDTNYKTITLVWDAVEGATAYDIYRRGYKEDAEYELVDTVSATTYESVGVMTGKEYAFYVVAKNDAVRAQLSGIVTASTTLQGEVTLEMEQVSTSKFHLSWNKVDGATRYIVYRKRNDDKMKKVLTLGGDVFEYTTAEMPNGDYQFQVKAGRYDSTDRVMTGASNKVSGSVEAMKPSVTATAGTKSAKISWKKMEGVTHYQVYRATSSTGKYTKLITTKELSYTAKSLTAGKKYYFKVRGYKTYKSGTDIQYTVYTPYSSTKSVIAK